MTEIQPTAGDGRQHGALDTAEMINKTRSVLRERLDQQPYLVLGLAAAVGYVLAAGMPRPLTSYLIRYGVRTGLRSGLRSLLGTLMPGGQGEEREE